MLDWALAAIALGCLGTLAWVIRSTEKTTREMSTAFSTTLAKMAQVQMEGVSDLVLGRSQDSAPSSEQSSTASNESETPKRDEWSLDDMPEHIRQTYEREAQEDSMMAKSSTPSTTPLNGSSPLLTDPAN